MTWAIVPMKRYGEAKSRLAPILSPAQRAAFARETFLSVLACVAAEVDGVLVATDGEDVAADARAHGAEVLLDAEGRVPLRAVVDRAVRHLVAPGRARVAVVLADLPELGRDDVRALLAPSGKVVAPDAAGLGTNALVVPLGTEVRTAFGSGESFRLHREGTTVVRRDGLATDIDTPEDWYRWRASRA